MFNYLKDKSFVEFVLNRDNIPFIVRGTLECKAHFDFNPVVGIRVSGPTLHLKVIGEDENQKVMGNYHVDELTDEAIFPGEIDLPEKNITGISKALYGLELWANFLCLAVGNPKIKVEIQRPVNAVIVSRSKLDGPALDRWAELINVHFQLDDAERKKVTSALWWYRKACAAAYYSVFDSYTANWNCLEILCSVSGSRINKGSKVDEAIQNYLKGRKRIKAGHILECFNKYVNYSIVRQMKDALTNEIGKEQAKQLVYQCFEILPEENRLYQIRNDINHGNIHENSERNYERVYLRGMLLSEVVMMLLYRKLGHPISVGMDINTLAEGLSNLLWREASEE